MTRLPSSSPPGATIVPFPALIVQDDASVEEWFSTHLPVYSLAAAGYFGEGHEVEGWADVSSVQGHLDDSMFVSQVVGRSMEDQIPDGSFCVFRRIAAGTRQGKIVLAQHRDIADQDTGGSCTVKRYESAKQASKEGIIGTIELRPDKPDFESIVLTPVTEEEVLVLAELVAVLGAES